MPAYSFAILMASRICIFLPFPVFEIVNKYHTVRGEQYGTILSRGTDNETIITNPEGL